MSEIIEKVVHLFENHGDSQYGGEAVSQLEHALQAAHFADEAGEKKSIIVAGILHDIGHLLHHLPDDAPENGIDDLHENLANDFLQQYFTPEVVPLVLARYFGLPGQRMSFSPASIISIYGRRFS